MQGCLQSSWLRRTSGCPRRRRPAAHRKTPGRRLEIRNRPPGSAGFVLLRHQGQVRLPHRVRGAFRHACGLSGGAETGRHKGLDHDRQRQADVLAGTTDAGTEYDPPHTTMFDQPDLGYAREDPELYEDKWHALENRVFDLLDSGQPLTISAEGKSYVLPPINARRWRARFQKIC